MTICLSCWHRGNDNFPNSFSINSYSLTNQPDFITQYPFIYGELHPTTFKIFIIHKLTQKKKVKPIFYVYFIIIITILSFLFFSSYRLHFFFIFCFFFHFIPMFTIYGLLFKFGFVFNIVGRVRVLYYFDNFIISSIYIILFILFHSIWV